MTDFLVDSNVILDVLTEDTHWFDWSAAQLADCAQTGTLHINIGAHAFLCGYTLLSRDATRYQTYFPELILISP